MKLIGDLVIINKISIRNVHYTKISILDKEK